MAGRGTQKGTKFIDGRVENFFRKNAGGEYTMRDISYSVGYTIWETRAAVERAVDKGIAVSTYDEKGRHNVYAGVLADE